MKPGYVHISYLMDSSQIVTPIAASVIEGFNSFIFHHKAAPEESCTFTWVRFNNVYEYLYKLDPVTDVRWLDIEGLNPRGTVSLIDSACKLIDETARELGTLHEDDQPEHVYFVIQSSKTDESSWQYKMPDLATRIAEKTSIEGWNFILVGDATTIDDESIRMGIDTTIPYQRERQSILAAFNKLTDITMSSREE